MDYLSLLIVVSIALCAFLLAYVAGNWIWNVRDIARHRAEALATESDSRKSLTVWAWTDSYTHLTLPTNREV